MGRCSVSTRTELIQSRYRRPVQLWFCELEGIRGVFLRLISELHARCARTTALLKKISMKLTISPSEEAVLLLLKRTVPGGRFDVNSLDVSGARTAEAVYRGYCNIIRPRVSVCALSECGDSRMSPMDTMYEERPVC
jgi:hypothetical protein